MSCRRHPTNSGKCASLPPDLREAQLGVVEGDRPSSAASETPGEQLATSIPSRCVPSVPLRQPAQLLRAEAARQRVQRVRCDAEAALLVNRLDRLLDSAEIWHRFVDEQRQQVALDRRDLDPRHEVESIVARAPRPRAPSALRARRRGR